MWEVFFISKPCFCVNVDCFALLSWLLLHASNYQGGGGGSPTYEEGNLTPQKLSYSKHSGVPQKGVCTKTLLK